MADLPHDSTAGAPCKGKAGAPVVDLTATVQGLYAHADACRETALTAERLAAQQRREADYLEDLASILDGTRR